MNEIALSNDLNVITAEINSYKQVAGQAIFEIGKRLKHVKENDLVHGEFGKWLESMEIDRNFATRSMKVAEELSNSNYVTWNNLSSRALYEIATLPQEEREKEHETNGQTKTVDEMTVRELQEVKHQNKQLEQAKQQAEQQTEQAKKSEQIMQKQLEESESKKPETVEVIKEVAPADLKKEFEDTNRDLKFARKEIERLTKNQEYVELEKNDFDEGKVDKQKKKLYWESEKNVLEMKVHVDTFLKNTAVTAFRKGAIASADSATKRKLKDSVEDLKEFTKQMEIVLSGRIEIK